MVRTARAFRTRKDKITLHQHLMNYRETLQYLYNQLPMYQRIGKAAYKADLATTIALDEYSGHPHRRFKSVHTAGTNGKGSVSHILASVLHEAGYRTGLYTSPHLKDFRERIKIDGRAVEEGYVVEFVGRHRGIFEKISPSFFEMTAAMAFDYFAREKVDIAVVETGMGGRLDSTNIITPVLSVITNIGMDHTEFLGDTLQAIAREKAGIIKKGVPVVIGELQEETMEIFIESARRNGSEISFAPETYACDHAFLTPEGRQSFYISRDGKKAFDNLETDLLGFYQQKNIITFLQALDILRRSGLRISTENIYAGLRNVSSRTGLRGRWQILGSNPLVVCDTAHNKEGITEVLGQIRATPHRKLHMVIGFVNDKNTGQILDLFPSEAVYYFTQASIPRALDASVLKNQATIKGLKGRAYGTVQEAFDAAGKAARREDLIFIGGSTFVVAEVV